MIRPLFLALITICGCGVSAQNKVNYSLYNYSLNLINPAFAGQQNHTEILINSRSQWTGIEQSPKTNTVCLNLPFKNNVGVGINVISDKIFVFDQTEIALDFSYKVKMTESLDLQFGLKAQGNMYSGGLNRIKTEQPNDDFFSEPIDEFSPNFSIGAAVIHKDYFVHLSIGSLLKDRRYKQLNTYKQDNHSIVQFGGGYTVVLNGNLKLTPSTLVRIEPGVPLSFDINTTLEIKQKYHVGLSYSWNNSIQINGLAFLSKWLGLGYGYSLYNNNLKLYQNGTHEFSLLFNMDKIF